MLRPTDRTSFPPVCKCRPRGRVSGPAGLAPEALQERGFSCRGFTVESCQWAWYVFQPASAMSQPASVTHARLAPFESGASQEVYPCIEPPSLGLFMAIGANSSSCF
jgi:hypothetical protein